MEDILSRIPLKIKSLHWLALDRSTMVGYKDENFLVVRQASTMGFDRIGCSLFRLYGLPVDLSAASRRLQSRDRYYLVPHELLWKRVFNHRLFD